MPPKGEVAPQGPWTAEAETSAFKSLLAQVGGGKTRATTDPAAAEVTTARQKLPTTAAGRR